MKLQSIVWLTLTVLLAGCGGEKQEPVGIGQTVTFTAGATQENPFSGKKTESELSADVRVDAVMLVRNPEVDSQASLLLVIVRVKNNAKDPLTLLGSNFNLITGSGKAYQGHDQNWSGTDPFPAALKAGRAWSRVLNKLGPDMTDSMLVAFRTPLNGPQETAYLAIGDLKLVQLKDESSTVPANWLVCEGHREAVRVYEQFPYLR